MQFSTPKTPGTTTPQQKIVKPGLFSRLINYTASDHDYIAPLKITKTAQPKKPKNLKARLKAAIIIVITFYLLLCAFVLMNPQYALFFNNVLGVQYLTIRSVLEYTIYVVYSVLGIILGAGFLFFGFRALVVRTKSNAKRVNIWLLTVFFCLVFFGNVYLFARTYDWFRKIDFGNLEGRVLVYDNTILKYAKTEEDYVRARISPDVKIGPINIRYDISAYITRVARLEGLLLTQPYTFQIDYEGDGKFDRGSGQNNYVDVPVSNPQYAPMIAPEYAYNEIKKYIPTATIEGIDVGGKAIKLTLELPEMELQKIISIDRTPLQDGSIQYAFDATSIGDLGQVKWIVLNASKEEKIGYQFAPKTTFETPTIICLQIFQGYPPVSQDSCDWKFITEEPTKGNIQDTDISIKVDLLNPLKYQFSINPTVIQGNIDSITWYADDRKYVGKFDSGTEKILDYTFHNPGTYKIEAEIFDTLGNSVRVSPGPVFTAELVDLKDGYTLQIEDDEGSDLDKDAYDKQTKTYILQDFPVPGTLFFNAIKVRANSPRLQLEKVEWDGDGLPGYEVEGFSYEKDLPVPGRYNVNVRYTFSDLSIDGKNVPIYHLDRVAVIGIQKDIDVRIKVTPESEYAPTNVRFDTTGSTIHTTGEIQKFIYEFGDGKTYEGEGIIPSYRYANPGVYNIKVTAVSNKGKKSSKTYTLVLKKQQETVRIEPSIASGMAEAGLPITFDANVRGTDNVVTWNMGDGTTQKIGKTLVYEFATPGTYTIQVRVQYMSGIEESDSITYIVK